jgi:hypothetical protein
MKRVHNDPGTSPKGNASGSPPPSTAPARGKKRKPEASDAPFAERALKKISTPPVFGVQTQEPSLVERYIEAGQKLLEIVKQLNDPRNTSNMTLLRSASNCIKVMARTTQRINATPASNFKQQSG